MSDGYADMAIRGIRYPRNCRGTFEGGCRVPPKAGSSTPLVIESGNQPRILGIGCTETGHKMWLLILTK